MRRRLAAILAADIVGYSALIAEDEEGTLGAFKQLQRNFIEPLVNDHRGRIVKTLGDGFLIEFQSAVDAVTAAVAWQRGMPDTDASAGLRFRIGINLGDIVIDEDDIHGDGVNIATRLEGVSQPGGICVADVVYQSVVGKVETGFTDLGEVQLKNIRNGIRAWQWTEAMTALRHARSKLPDERDPVTELSIAVLPFDDMSSDPDQAYFCDGITEDLITELSLVPGLTIIARLSSFAYKNRSADAREIGRDLSVRNLVEGSVRRSGNRLRITAQLIETKNGRHLWAQKYDRELADVFAVQDDVVHQIVGALSDTLSLPIDRAESRAWPDNLEAYEYVVRGRQNLLSAQGHDRAKQYLEQAIKLDPSLSDAHAWLAVYYYTDWFLYNREPQRHMRQRILGPGLDRCVRRRKGGRHAGALQSLHRALSINPNEADALT